MYCYYDIETIANDRAREYYERFWRPSGTCTKPETIAAKKKEQVETLDGAGLKWWTGRVACICAESDFSTFSMIEDDEKVLLAMFFLWCKDQESEGTSVYIGKNADEFDCPFLIGRGMSHRLRLPYALSGKSKKSPVRDVNEIFGYRKNGQHGSLNDYLWGLNIETKISHGSEVQGMWNDGKKEEIKTYCADDVQKTKAIHKIWMECTE